MLIKISEDGKEDRMSKYLDEDRELGNVFSKGPWISHCGEFRKLNYVRNTDEVSTTARSSYTRNVG